MLGMIAGKKRFPTSGIKSSSHKKDLWVWAPLLLIQIIVINPKRKRVSGEAAKIIKKEKGRKKNKRQGNRVHAIVRLIAVFSDLFLIVQIENQIIFFLLRAPIFISFYIA